jgi:Rps23 Pro-64 3,4-dihydroxylase Tpa1-like proline 4-hydroxylase
MNIQQYQAVFSREHHDYIVARTVNHNGWYFGGHSTDSAASRFWYMDLNSDEIFTQALMSRISDLTNETWRLDRVYANGQTHGLSGSMHQDTMGSDGSWFTFLYYVGPTWQPEWGGATVFHDRDTGGLQLYYPTPNSAVLFDAAIWHQGQEPTRQCQELRVTVAWKLQKL